MTCHFIPACKSGHLRAAVQRCNCHMRNHAATALSISSKLWLCSAIRQYQTGLGICRRTMARVCILRTSPPLHLRVQLYLKEDLIFSAFKIHPC